LTDKDTALLQIERLETGYGKKQVLFDISLQVGKGEIVALIGPNGSGKSTTLKSVCGLLPAWKGEIRFNGSRIDGSIPAKNVARGITFAPQGNRVFDELTVRENLEIGGYQLKRKELKGRIEYVLEIFPILKESLRREAGKLSGGEQQQLSVARALVPKPKLLMLDEPSLGLQPNIVKDVFEKVVEINHETGVSILIIEQKVRDVLEFCDKVYALKLGRIAFTGPPEELKGDKEKLKQIFL
jgi:branched-chain amino acid transport system ATP-binding protein